MKRRLFAVTICAILLLSLMAISGVLLHGNAVDADSNQEPVTKIRYLTDEEFMELMVKTYGPEASKVQRVNTEVDLDSQDGFFFATPQTTISANWCGYYLDNGEDTTIRGVIGQFPARHCTGYQAVNGTWVGIGGLVSNNLLQTGVNMYNMQTFVECLPGAAQHLFDVNEGDDIHASVGYHYSNYWFVSIWDQTTQQGWGNDIYFVPATNNADWIVETVYGYHTGTFDTVSFSYCRWWDSSLTYHDMNWGPGDIWKNLLLNYYNEVLIPSSIGPDNRSFSVTPD